jgi:exodeoxyribonuclease-5
MELTKLQQEAIEKGVAWFKKEDFSRPFVIAGLAGTGKSSAVKELVVQLGLTNEDVNFCTFTGKAALVLSRKGNPACTIHRLIYDPTEVEEYISKIDGTKVSVEEFLKNPDLYKIKTKMVFLKKFMLDPTIKLIIVDEVSMVNAELMRDLMSFYLPVICLGDPEQLPPVGGENNGLLHNPDIFLNEIHRQAEGNPIIYLSMLAREGKRIYPGNYKMNGKSKAVVISKKDGAIPDEALLNSSQVICGRNKTRHDLNAYIRNLMGFKGKIPNKGEKLVCLKNDWTTSLKDIFLINGLIGYVKDDILNVDFSKKIFRFDYRPDFLEEDYFEGLIGDLRRFTDLKNIDNDDENNRKDSKANEFDYGYAITCHKSQGSEWPNLTVYHEYMGDSNSKWLYTAITRSSNKLILYI